MSELAKPSAPQVDTLTAHDALSRVLGSATFRNAVRQRRFLEFVSEETLGGRGSQLKERTIAVAGLGEPSTFDPRTDPLVRVLANRVRGTLARYYEVEGNGDPMTIELQRGTYSPRFVSRPAVGLGIARHRDHLLAISTFADLTPDGHAPHTAVGFTEALVASFTGLSGIQIVGPLVGSGPGDETTRALDIGERFGVDFVLTGSVRTTDGTLSSTMRLIDAGNGVTVWSDRFGEKTGSGDAFDAIDLIVRRTRSELLDELIDSPQLGPRAPRTSDPVVQRAMIGFHAYARTLDQTEEAEVAAALEDAVDREPANSTVLAALASVRMFRGVGDAQGVAPSPDLLASALSLAERALAIDPTNPNALLVVAFGDLHRGDAAGCRRRIRKLIGGALQAPSVLGMCGIGLCLSDAWDEGIELLLDSSDMNPDHPRWVHGFFALDALRRGDLVGALFEAEAVDTPGLLWGPVLRAAAHGALGQLDQARDALRVLPGFPLEPTANRALFTSYMRLPDAVAGPLADALAAIEHPTTAAPSRSDPGPAAAHT